MPSFDEILNEIEKKSGTARDEMMKRINKKQKDLFGLVSLEGAAHLIAKEYGIEISNNEKKLKIENIMDGMRKLNFSGRVFRTSNIVEFKRADGSPGKVVNIFIGDSTGFVKLALWDKQVKLIEDEVMKIGDTIEIANAMVKENVYGDIEVSIGKFGNIKTIDDLGFPSSDELNKRFSLPVDTRVQIRDIVPGTLEIKANIIRVFKGNFIFNTCSICGNAMEESNGKLICVEHGETEYNPCLVLSMIVDDGTGDLRVTFFRDLAEKIVGMSAGEISDLDLAKRYELINEKLIGKELIIRGRVKKNKMFDRLEMIAQDFKDINILEESKNLFEELKLKVGV